MHGRANCITIWLKSSSIKRDDSWGSINNSKPTPPGIGGIVVSLTCECILQALYAGTDNQAGQRAAVFFIYLFICFWSSCKDATQFLYLSEIFPTAVRSSGTAVGMGAWFCAQVVILVAGPIALNNIGWKFFLVLIVPSTLYWFAIYYLFPETKQQSLEDLKGTFGEQAAKHYHSANVDEQKEPEQAVRRGSTSDETKGSETHHIETTELEKRSA
ncbi:hypothetical protein R6Q59_010036 [Mikania micrantha]